MVRSNGYQLCVPRHGKGRQGLCRTDSHEAELDTKGRSIIVNTWPVIRRVLKELQVDYNNSAFFVIVIVKAQLYGFSGYLNTYEKPSIALFKEAVCVCRKQRD